MHSIFVSFVISNANTFFLVQKTSKLEGENTKLLKTVDDHKDEIEKLQRGN